jgi:Zn finger protein HypA/HybF involved in hydrogenase expression
MTLVSEKQFWCEDCKRTHMVKVHSSGELSKADKATFLAEGEYAEQLKKHTVCGTCGGNILPHTDLTIVAIKGEWKEICPECARTTESIAS